ncbi:MAG: FGGY-family carbohydrate kinase [Spirochaetes bacterium]|nr:FGGY-family carbohydrate kinase [Spirochaetota bacterium]
MNSNDTYVLAIDLGTSGPKSALVSLSGEVAATAFEETPVILIPGGGAEQDPGCWWKTITSTAKKAIDTAKIPADRIAAVSVTSQWSGTVAVDRSGNHLMNAIIWMDSRGADVLKEEMRGLFKFEGYPIGSLISWLKLTGGAPAKSGKDPMAHIYWIRKYCSDVYRNTYKFLEPKDYINLRLTGKFASTFDTILMHWVCDNRDPNNVRYSDKLLKIAGIERDKLPDLIRAVDILGPLKNDVAEQLGLKQGTPVIGGTPDVPSAAVGSGAVKDYEGHLYIGTSSWICTHVPFKKTDMFHAIGSFPSPIPGRYLVLTEQECAGKCLMWLRDNLLYHKDELLHEENLPDIYKILDKIVARTPAGANNVMFTPWLYGERTPVEDHHIRSSLFNLSLENTREDIARAVFEGVAMNQRWLLMYEEKFMKRPFAHLNFIGGGANSDIWSQIIADVTNRKIRQVADPLYANARGATFLAGIALGLMSTDDISQGTKIKAEYTPNPAHRKIYDELFAEYLNLYTIHKKVCARVNTRTVDSCAPTLQAN